MTPQQALQFIDSALVGITTSREGHSRIVEAVQVLAQAIEEPKDGNQKTDAKSDGPDEDVVE